MRSLWPLLFLLPALLAHEHRTIVGVPRFGPTALACFVLGASLAMRAGSSARPSLSGGADGSKTTDSTGTRATLALAAFSFALLALWAPQPVAATAWLVAATVGALATGWSVPAGLRAYALAGLAAAITHWLSPMLLVRAAETSFLAVLGSSILALLGVDAPSTVRGIGFAVSAEGTLEMGTGWMHFGVREGLSLGVAGAVAWLATPGLSVKRLFGFVGALALGAVSLFVVLTATYVETHSNSLVTELWLRAAAFGLPALTVLLLWERDRSPGASAVSPAVAPVEKRAVFSGLAALLLLAGGTGLAWAALSVPPSRSGPIRVAVDEGHSQWERLDVPLDRGVYGTLATYNYSEWMRGLGELHGEVDRIRERLTPERLDGVDVLILKTPTLAYGVDEVDTIHAFVENGGGVYMVVDHNDVFGMNTILNSVAERYGIHYRDDALGEIEFVGGQIVRGEAFPPHPLTAAMDPMRYMTSCSLEVSRGARPLLWLNRGFADDPDYSKNNFIGDGQLRGGERLAPLAQLVEARAGRGKVLAFTDSTLFSSFSIFFPGVRELAFGGVTWLGQEEHSGWIRGVIGAWALLLLAAVLAGATPDRALGTTLVLAGLALGAGLAEWDSRTRLEGWDAEWKKTSTVFDMSLSAGRVPVWHESHDKDVDNFWGAFLAFQRSRRTMRVALDEDELLEGHTAVLVWPQEPLADGFIERVLAFVEQGGTLFVFDDRERLGDASNRLLAPYGLAFEVPDAGRRYVLGRADGAGRYEAPLEHSMAVRGGEPCVLDSVGDALVARARVGEGCVVAVGVAQSLSNARMATRSEVLGPEGFALLTLLHEAIDAADPGGERVARRP